MSTRVVTISTCDRCPVTHEAAGAQGRPRGWQFASITGTVRDSLLCPACVRDIEFALDDKPVRTVTTCGALGYSSDGGMFHCTLQAMHAGPCSATKPDVRSLRGSLPEPAPAARGEEMPT